MRPLKPLAGVPAFRREMGNIDRGDGVVGHDPDLAPRRQPPQRRLHLQDGKRAAKAASVNEGGRWHEARVRAG